MGSRSTGWPRTAWARGLELVSLEALQEKFPSSEITRIEIPTMTVNRFFTENGLKKVDFLFFNCEGAEYDIFAGDTSFLEAVRIVSLDLHGRCKAFNSRREEKLRIYDLMCASGFTRVGGHQRADIMTEKGHLTFLWERNALVL